MVAGADYLLLAPYDTFIRSTKPVSDRAIMCYARMAVDYRLCLDHIQTLREESS